MNNPSAPADRTRGEGLTRTDRQALSFLMRGPDVPGAITNDEVLAAHFVYIGLTDRGLVAKGMGSEGPIYSITRAGRRALADAEMRREPDA